MKRAGVMLFTVAVALVAAAGPAVAAPRQNQQFTITDDFSTGESTVVASGAINATGSDVPMGFKEAGRTGHSIDDFVFDDGTMHLKVKGVDDSTFDPSTCIATVNEKGNYVITGGDGAYAGIKGSGHFKVSGTIEFEQTEEGCNFDNATGTVMVDAPGKVKL
jgi:hypothetical protein